MRLHRKLSGDSLLLWKKRSLTNKKMCDMCVFFSHTFNNTTIKFVFLRKLIHKTYRTINFVFFIYKK